MMLIWTYFVKWLIPVNVSILSFLLLNPVTTTSDPKDICMNCPGVTLRCIKSHLCHVVSSSTCNVLFLFFTFIFVIVLHALSSLCTCTFVTCDIKYQSRSPVLFSQFYLSSDTCQNCSVLYCVPQLGIVVCLLLLTVLTAEIQSVGVVYS